MAVVTVRAPGKVNRRIVGVTFTDGRAEVDTESAAFQFFKRQGYKIKGEVPEVEEPETQESDESEDQGDEPDSVDEPEPEADDETVEPETQESDESEDQGDEPDSVDEPEPEADDETVEPEAPERPHPVQGSKAVWFEHLTALKPDHGFDLATVSRKALIEAVEAIEGN